MMILSVALALGTLALGSLATPPVAPPPAPALASASGPFVGLLTGAQEVPPVVTRAVSFASFQFTPGDTYIVGYRLNFNHDQTVDGVHIHDGAVGVSGPIVLNMRPTSAGEGICIDLAGGLLTYYILTPAALRGSLAGKTLTDLKDLMCTGNTYLNLHTPENPSGWIRGQLAARTATN